MLKNLKATSLLLIAFGFALLAACNTTLIPQVNNPATGNDVEPNTFNLTVARHEDQPFSANRVDRILADASAILLSEDTTCPDVTCPVTFARSGPVDTFDIASAAITTEAQLDAVFDHPADIKVVNMMVGVCGTFSPGDMAVIIGCAYTGGSAVLTQDAPFDVWAHEWGHVQSLPHRDDCATNLMHSYELETDAVNATERAAFLSPTPSGFGLRTTPAAKTAGQTVPADASPSVNEWIDTVLPRPYLAGIPEALIPAEHGTQLVDALLAAWAELPHGPQRTNTIRTLGLLGDPTACDVLIELLEAFAADPDPAALPDAAEAMLALGRLAGADGSDAAIAYLTSRTQPEAWTKVGVDSADVDSADNAEHALVAARLAVMSLGLTDHPDGVEHLHALRDEVTAGRLTDPWFAAQVNEALARSSSPAGTFRIATPDDRQP